MALNPEIGHSSYMIGKAESRLRYQRMLSENMPVDIDAKERRKSDKIISNLEERLVYLHYVHFSLISDDSE